MYGFGGPGIYVQVLGIMQLYLYSLNNKRFVAFKRCSLRNVIQRDGNSFMNFQLGCFISFFRSGPLFTFGLLFSRIIVFQLAGFYFWPWRMFFETGDFVLELLYGIGLLSNNFQQQQNSWVFIFFGNLGIVNS